LKFRHDLHRHPELAFQEYRTAGKIAETLKQWGYEVTAGVGKTGVVAGLTCGTSAKSMGLRADMDALPIAEETGLPYASIEEGRMHACGHDGHVTMLLGAARYLAETRSFNGTVRLYFQPAEEIIEGAAAMIKDGLFERFPVDAVFAIHLAPELPLGILGTRSGPAMASADRWRVILTGIGGHGAIPEKAIDPIVAGSSIVMALQTVVSRNVSPHLATVVTVGSFQSGDTDNIIPHQAILRLSIRNTHPETRLQVLERIRTIIMGQAASYGVECEIQEMSATPVLLNDPELAEFARTVARDLFGHDRIAETPLIMASEDFAFMVQEKPGCLCNLGTGGNFGLHHPEFVLNDDVLVPGASFWAALVERFLA
jgi:hippurate hydrolase